ncbi:MAG: M28 family peptidase [Gemmatimonadaceae bacterium]
MRWFLSAAVLTGAACSSPSNGPIFPEGPRVLEVSPAPNATGVALNSVITVHFNEKVTPVNPAAIVVTSGGRPVAGQTHAGSDQNLHFTLKGAFDPGASYQVELTTNVTNNDGAMLRAGQTWSFSVRGNPLPVLSAERIMQDIVRLAHDSLRGRESGSDDEARAAAFVRQRYQEIGLTPATADYLQPFVRFSNFLNREVNGRNVLAVLPGAGALAADVIIIGAHIDHIGPGVAVNGQFPIFNGADDNASGVALVLEMARALHQWKASGGAGGEAHRTIAFHAYGAEEAGLLGSSHYCANPTVDPLRISAMLNLDMVGRLRDRELFLGGLWTSPEWSGVIGSRRGTDFVIRDKRDCQSCSDHSCYMHSDKPVLWFFTGFHDDYHGPDDIAERINPQGVADVGALVMSTAVQLAVRRTLLQRGTRNPGAP